MVPELGHSAMPNGKVYLFLDPMRLNQTLKRPVHRGPTINYILSKLTNGCHMTLMGVSSCFHNLILDKNHLTKPHLHVSSAGID